jgi:hypothetical protein
MHANLHADIALVEFRPFLAAQFAAGAAEALVGDLVLDLKLGL